MREFEATGVHGYTLVGHGGERPQELGNCFTVATAEGEVYKILNFNFENLEALEDLGLDFPIKCRQIGERLAIIHDPRIGERWYQRHYCQVCCPRELLQPFQQQANERDVMRGRRTEHPNFTQYNLRIEAEYP